MRRILFLLFVLAAESSHAQNDLINRTVLRRDSNFIFRDEYKELRVIGRNSRVRVVPGFTITIK